MTEARVPKDSEIAGKTVADMLRMGNGDVRIAAIIRDETRSSSPFPDAPIRENDLLLLEGEPDALESIVARSGLKLSGEHRRPDTEQTDEVGVIEAIVGPNSALSGASAERFALYERYQVNLIAISRSGKRFTERLRDITLGTGDVIVLQGNLTRLPDTLKDLGCLPLAHRAIRLGNARRSLLPHRGARRRDGAGRVQRAAGGHRVLRRGRAPDFVRLADVARSLRDDRMAHSGHARLR